MKLLFADDNAINQRVVRTMVSRLGHEVHTVDNGQEAIDAIHASSEPFHAVLMDMMMPVLSGVEATRQIRAMGNPIHVIGLTANAGANDKRACMDAGMDDFLTKPFDMDGLRRVLGRVQTSTLHTGTLKAFVESMGEDDDFLVHLFTEFLTEANRSRTEIHAALKSEEPVRIERVVHNLKANSAMFGARRLTDLCAGMEKDAHAGDIDGIRGRMSAFEGALVDVQRDVQRLIDDRLVSG
ncbi:MAG: response regulator [Rhodothermales bacterium]